MNNEIIIELVMRFVCSIFLLSILSKTYIYYKRSKNDQKIKSVIRIFQYAFLGSLLSIVATLLVMYKVEIHFYRINEILRYISNTISVNYSLRFAYLVFPKHPRVILENIVHNLSGIIIGIIIVFFFIEESFDILFTQMATVMALLIFLSSFIVVIYSKKSAKSLKGIHKLELELYYYASLSFLVFLFITIIFQSVPFIANNLIFIGQIINANLTKKSFFEKEMLQRKLYILERNDIGIFFKQNKKKRNFRMSLTSRIIKKIQEQEIKVN